MKTIALWALALTLIILGFAGTVVPGLPGIVLIYAGMITAAWIDDFTRIGWLPLTVLGVLTLLGFAADLLAAALGAKRVGASRQAIIGSVIGAFAGIPLGLAGIVLGPFVGAVVGEFMARQRLQQAARVGFGTVVGLLVGTLARLAIAIAMLGVFAFSYFL